MPWQQLPDAQRRALGRWLLGTGAAAWMPAGQAKDPSEGTLRLLRAPRVALVIGNGRYAHGPALKNAPNDAVAIAETLGKLKFTVTRLLDAPRETMLAAIREHTQTVQASKAVGLFYFAGHGLQLAWHNYLLPVDAAIASAEDVPRQGIDLDGLLKGLGRAANAMNVIVLDACRENPFASDFRGQAKGLSQVDAPRNTLLAYATAPGNVASDGEGGNGLYTAALLRELQVPEAKIEEVFKRVRLAVRLKSAGAQVPWESTSLEEDFWFLPPAQWRSLTQEERLQRYREELAQWQKAHTSGDAAALEAFLRRYPSGVFSELAQLEFDRAQARRGEKRIAIATAEGNPFTKGTVRSDTAYRLGDSYSYRLLALPERRELRRTTATVATITDHEVLFDNGLVTDLLGNTLRANDGRRFSPRQQFPLEYAVGYRWHSRYSVSTRQGDDEGLAEFDLRIVGRERIRVPAGSFDTFRIEAVGETVFKTFRTQSRWTRWMAPGQVRRAIAVDEELRRGERVLLAERQELLAFKQA